MVRIILVLILTSSLLMQFSLEETFCNIPKDCKVLNNKKRHIETKKYTIKCIVESRSQIRFKNSLETRSNGKDCRQLNKSQIIQLNIGSKKEGSVKLEKNMIELNDLIGLMNMLNLAKF